MATAETSGAPSRNEKGAEALLAANPQGREQNDELLLLQESHLFALSTDREVVNHLKSAELRKLLLTIDRSRSRLDALAAARTNIDDFDQFCRTVLRVIKHHRSEAQQ